MSPISSEKELNSLSQRFKRYAHVSTALSGPAMRLMLDQLFGQVSGKGKIHNQAETLAKALGALKGPVMKIAQFLGTIPDAVPPAYTEAFQTLQTQASPMGRSFVARRMKGELGENWMKKFSSFELVPVAAASLGQVHRAQSLHRETLACKLQYPEMASAVEADLQQFHVLMKIYESTLGALKMDQIFIEIADRLREELDYRLEAHHMILYQQMLSSLEKIQIPTPFPPLSTSRLLTMTWLEGVPLHRVLHLPQKKRNTLAQTLFQAWYLPFYHYGFLHGDPHLGNYTFGLEGKVNIFDFGCIRKFPPRFVQGVVALYESLRDQNEEQEVYAYEIWGFKNMTRDLIQVLHLWAKMLYEPVLEDRIRPIQYSQSGVYGRQTAAHVHQELRRLGGVQPPREFVFMDRAAVGLGSAFMHLGAELNWHQEFQKLIDAFSVETLGQRQTNLLNHYRESALQENLDSLD